MYNYDTVGASVHSLANYLLVSSKYFLRFSIVRRGNVIFQILHNFHHILREDILFFITDSVRLLQALCAASVLLCKTLPDIIM